MPSGPKKVKWIVGSPHCDKWGLKTSYQTGRGEKMQTQSACKRGLLKPISAAKLVKDIS